MYILYAWLPYFNIFSTRVEQVIGDESLSRRFGCSPLPFFWCFHQLPSAVQLPAGGDFQSSRRDVQICRSTPARAVRVARAVFAGEVCNPVSDVVILHGIYSSYIVHI